MRTELRAGARLSAGMIGFPTGIPARAR